MYWEFKEGTNLAFNRGQNFDVRSIIGDSRRILTLENAPFIQSSGGNYVYVLGGGGAEKRRVTLEAKNPQYFEVVDGLKEGEKVIISNYESFNQSAKISIKGSD